MVSPFYTIIVLTRPTNLLIIPLKLPWKSKAPANEHKFIHTGNNQAKSQFLY